MMRVRCFRWIGLGVVGVIISFAVGTTVEAGTLSLVGGGSFNRAEISGVPAGSSAQGTGAQPGYAGGLLINLSLEHSMFTLELGGLYVRHKEAIGSGFISTSAIEIPLDFRYWLFRGVSIGAGGYYSTAQGNLQLSDRSGNVTYDGVYSGYRTKEDFGGLGSLRIELPLSLSTHFLLDGNYLYGLRNINDSGDGTTLKNREFQGLIGLSFDW